MQVRTTVLANQWESWYCELVSFKPWWTGRG